ncbi:hypothetical protein SAMN05444365_1011078 [Micromonospora pattaloongensis]|uniref:Uncharacterized protein n=1 Tax=Micromonospora pattaloongensis TaxID=405436 RepID=A0A1H3I1A8_9ACTN|nr:hypothetical protein [Micromonospora pattaloongensis]SDY21491.1 hypothetical protein SAMN05444365_1011078 [Micromonospora pattaloongensis]
MSDNFDTLIADAFAEFDAAERSSYLPAPGAPAVRHKVAVRRRVHLTAFSVAGALLIAVPIAAYATSPRGNNSPPNVVGSASPAETASPTPSLAPSSAPASPAPGSSAPAAADLRNATLNLPAFPDYEAGCMAKGKRKFVNGTATPRDGVQLVIGELAPIKADLDGVPGDEQLTTIRCQHRGSMNVTQLLALKVASDGALTSLGYVINSADTPNVYATFSREAITVDDGVVRLVVYGPYQTNGWRPCDRQVRGYALRDGAFRQVSGPTTFRVPSKNFHEVDFRNTGLLMGRNNPDGSGKFYCVPMVNGAGEADLDNNGDPNKGTTRYTITIGAVTFVNTSDGEATFAILTLRSPSGEMSQTLQSFQRGGDHPLGWEILRSGTNGVSRIEKAEVSGDIVQVTVTTTSGQQQVWSYRPSAINQSWQRVSS